MSILYPAGVKITVNQADKPKSFLQVRSTGGHRADGFASRVESRCGVESQH